MLLSFEERLRRTISFFSFQKEADLGIFGFETGEIYPTL